VARSMFLTILIALIAFGSRAGQTHHSEASSSTAPQIESEEVKFYAGARPYLSDSIGELRKHIPELDGAKSTTTQDPLPGALLKTGAQLDELLQKLPDLVAEETVSTSRWLDFREAVPTCVGMSGCVDSVPTSQKTERFDYFMLPHRLQNGVRRLDEYRTAIGQPFDKQDQPYFQGFASFWSVFSSLRRKESEFRYIGQQKMDGHSTFVVGFAQIPGAVKYSPTIVTRMGSVPMLLQGLAWIDEKSFRIVRLRADLLSPQPEIGYESQASTIRFGQARIPALALDLWLPKNVSVETIVQGQLWREQHAYSKFRLYEAKSKILLSPQ